MQVSTHFVALTKHFVRIFPSPIFCLACSFAEVIGLSCLRPSTFSQAAKLRRMAAAKEKELAKHQEQQMLERKTVYDPYMKYVTPVKALTYLLLTVWFWKSPIAAISKELVQPIGTVLSWKSGGDSVDKVTYIMNSDKAYSCKQIDEVRDLWGKFVLEHRL
ncbi:hypothetical protein RND81_01G169600 [Saponaria officinalis]|uniref:Uncharacterized protein n=1 Tax=Saponaria officinalis TaxID=3572 RepID=A0AAW1NG78_SAPOF